MLFNQYGFDDVDYDSHFQQFAQPFMVDGNMENNRYFINEAQQNHILAINNALLGLVGDALILLSVIDLTQEAEHYFRFGVMRRLRMIDRSFKSLQNLIPPDRSIPLTQEQSDDVCRNLNSIYIDLLGLLDNYAWTAIYQVGTAVTRSANPLSIGLFKKTFSDDATLKPIADAVLVFADWEKDIKTRRNPAAHRMPLYVPSAAMTSDEIHEYEALEDQISNLLRMQEFEKHKALRKKQQRIGSFLPRFLHDPDGQVMNIYPTIPQDVGQTIKIGRIVQTFLRDQGSVA